MKEIEGQIFEQKQAIEVGSRPIRKYEHSVKKLEEANNRLYNAQAEYKAIQAKQSKLNTEAKDELQKNIEAKMKKIGEQDAKNYKARMKTKNSHEILRLMMNKAKQDAYNDEINKDLTEEELKPSKEEGELEAQNNAQKQLNDISLTNRKTKFSLAKIKANNDFINSPEMKQINDQIIQNEIETKQMEQEIEQRDILTKAQKQVQKAYMTNELSSHFVEANLSAVEQVKYVMDTVINPKTNEFNEKDALAIKLKELRNTHPDAWETFSERYGRMVEMLDTSGHLNINIDELRNMVKLFDEFWQSYQPPPPPNYNNNNNNDDADFID